MLDKASHAFDKQKNQHSKTKDLLKDQSHRLEVAEKKNRDMKYNMEKHAKVAKKKFVELQHTLREHKVTKSHAAKAAWVADAGVFRNVPW